jgi:hypothetical protein
MYQEDKIINWCSYCHSEIFNNEDFICIKGKCYHRECFKQMKTIYDPFYFLDDDGEDIYNENDEDCIE